MDKNERAKTLLCELNYGKVDFQQPSLNSTTIRLLITFPTQE
jgi:hypothetical protein